MHHHRDLLLFSKEFHCLADPQLYFPQDLVALARECHRWLPEFQHRMMAAYLARSKTLRHSLEKLEQGNASRLGFLSTGVATQVNHDLRLAPNRSSAIVDDPGIVSIALDVAVAVVGWRVVDLLSSPVVPSAVPGRIVNTTQCRLS